MDEFDFGFELLRAVDRSFRYIRLMLSQFRLPTQMNVLDRLFHRISV